MWLVGEQQLRVLDLGAGTGKLTRTLVELGHEVVAVEPSAEMLAELRRALPAVEALVGSAEEIPLPDGSVDAVVAGQAFHWFAPARALQEIHRVLRPAGSLGVVWNVLDEARPVVQRLLELLPRSAGAAEPAATIASSLLFGVLEEARFSFERRLDRGDFVDNVGTQSSVATLAAVPKAETRAAVARLWDVHAGSDGLVLPYVTRAYRARVI